MSQGKVCTLWAWFSSSEEKRSGKLQNRRLSCTKNKVMILDQYLVEPFTVSAPVPPTSMEIFLPARHTNLQMCPFPRTCCTSLDPQNQTFSALPTLKLHSHSVARSPLWINHPQFAQFCLSWCIFSLSAHSLVPSIWGRVPGDLCPGNYSTGLASLFYIPGRIQTPFTDMGSW